MRVLHDRSIESRLSGTILVAVFVAILLSATAFAWRETERAFAAKRETLQGLASTLATTIAGAVEAGDRRIVAVGLNSIQGFPNVHYAIVVDDAEGRRLHEIGSGVVLGSRTDALVANQDIGAFASVRLGTYLISAPIVSGRRRVGQISLIADATDIRHALWTIALDAATVGLLASLLAVLIGSRLKSTPVIGPLASLTRATEAIRITGDYSHPVARHSDDEIGRLVDAFNEMMTEIGNRDEAIRRQRDGLAMEVASRTHELLIAKQAAERANAAKSDFIATVSHEIRTPMNGMLVMAELLAANALDAKARRQCDILLKSGQMLLALINDVLDLSKIEACELEIERTVCDPAELVEDTILLFADRARSRALELTSAIATDMPARVTGDPLRLRQVLANLVNNALKFTEHGGVQVSLDRMTTAGGAERLVFSVRDTGIGIAPDKLATLFEPFKQADASTTRRYGGTGTGLTICRRLAEAMQGAIR